MILSPATPLQAAMSVEAAYAHKGPVYIRIGMNHEKEFYDEKYQMQVGKNDILRDGGDVTLFVTGSILEEVGPRELQERPLPMPIILTFRS